MDQKDFNSLYDISPSTTTVLLQEQRSPKKKKFFLIQSHKRINTQFAILIQQQFIRANKTCSILTFFFYLFQYCEQIGLSRDTIFLVNRYIHSLLKKNRQNIIDYKNIILYCICCVSIVTKFNQRRQLSDSFSIQFIRDSLDGAFSINEVLTAENQILKSRRFKLKQNIPNQYIKSFLRGFPRLKKFRKIIPDLIYFAVTIPKLSCYSGRDIFYGTFLAILKFKHIILSPNQRQKLQSSIPDKENASSISEIIVEELQRTLNQEDQNKAQN